MITAESIKGYRKCLGMTQKEFAERWGVSLPLVKLWERDGIKTKDVKRARVIVEMYMDQREGE